MKRLLKGGRVVDPANGIDGMYDVLIDGDRIARVDKNLPAPEGDVAVVEVPRGFVVVPGLVDMHVHLREPGQEHAFPGTHPHGPRGADFRRGKERACRLMDP